MKRLRLFFVTMVVCSLLHGVEFPLAQNGRPLAVIQVDAGGTEASEKTVQELTHWLKEISGATFRVLKPGEVATGAVLRLSSDPTVLALFPEDSQALHGNDGYAVRVRGNTLYILGSSEKGVMNGVFRALSANTGIVWARPAQGGAFFKKDANLSFVKNDYREIPAFSLRGWLLSGVVEKGPLDEGYDWIVRNGGNFFNEYGGYNRNVKRYGMLYFCGSGHNLTTLFLPEKEYYDAHPDFYPLIKGKRVRPSDKDLRTQLCFTNPEMIRAFEARLDELVEQRAGATLLGINIEDNMDQCECPTCSAPIHLPDGRVLTKDDKSFYSTRYYQFLNHVARHLKTRLPEGEICSLAYLFTEIPPAIPVEKNIAIMYASVRRNSKYTFTHPENKEYCSYLNQWLNGKHNIVLRDYYGLQVDFPRPIDGVAVEDFRNLYKDGVNKHYSEIVFDRPPREVAGISSRNGTLIWDYSMPYFYVINEAMWHPDLDVSLTRRRLLHAVYGAAAPEMERFYGIIDGEWKQIHCESRWNDDPRSLWMRYVVNRNKSWVLIDTLDAALAKVTDPRARESIQRMREHIKQETAVRNVSHRAISITGTPVLDEDFETGEWLNAVPTDEFYYLRTKTNAVENTSVKVLYDDKNYYLGIRCSDMKDKAWISAPKGTLRDTWVRDSDKIELLLSGKDDKMYQFIIDVDGNIYDSREGDASWNGDIRIDSRKKPGKWSIMLTIPYSTLGLQGKPVEAPSFMIVRYRSSHGKEDVKGMSWRQGFPNVVETYGKLFF